MQKQLEVLLAVLPQNISDCIKRSDEYLSGSGINEIRIRAGKRISLTYKGKNVILSHRVSESEISEALMPLCKNSLYSYMDTIREGYIPFSDSIRIGVCGNAVCEGNKIVNLSNITSLNIRIPSSVYGISRELYSHLYNGGFTESVIVFSPPGVGKTTLLRDISLALSNGSPAKRVALIDSRYELCDERVLKGENIDLYAGYPKSKGIELATRTMSPEYIICDEIGSEEIDSILATQSGGVPLIVGAHASTLEKLLSSGATSRLHRSGMFDLYVKITLTESGERRLDIVRRSEIV